MATSRWNIALFYLLFLLLLIPLIIFALVAVFLFVIVLPIKHAVTQWLGRGRGGARPSDGPVIDVEVTRSEVSDSPTRDTP